MVPMYFMLFHGHRNAIILRGWIGSGHVSWSNGGNIVGIPKSKLISNNPS